jgi:hypothetical protein
LIEIGRKLAECDGEIESGHFPEAEATLEQLATAIDKGSATDPHFPGLVDRLRGLLQLRRGEAEAALQSVRASLAVAEHAPGSLSIAAQASLALGKPQDAEKFAQQSLGIAEGVAREPDTSADVGEALLLVAKAKIAEGRPAEARSLPERSVRCLTNGYGAHHPRTEEAVHLMNVGALQG